MRQRGEWLFNLPDVNGRTCLTGICKNPLNAMDPFLPLFNTLVTVKHDTSANFGYRIADDAITLTDAVILSVNFYDNYGFMSPDEYTGSTYFSSPHLSYNAESGFDNRYYTDHAEGLSTGTLTAVLDGSVVRGYLPSVSYYDYRGNVVQRKSGNHLIEGFEKEYFANNFTGAPLKRKHVHMATGQGTQTELYSYRYDHRGRLLEVSHQLNSNPAVNLLSNRYDALGRLISKKQHGAVETTNYAYNIRSWLTEINSKRFNQKLFYNDGNVGIRPLYNGNISAMRWSLSDERFSRFYKFRYDNLNRMTAAIYSESSDRANDNRNYYETQPDYTEYIDEYDKQGNIKKLTRYGLSKYHHSNAGTTYGFDEMDNLTLDYSGNQLQKVSDAATDPFYEGAFNFVDGNKTNDIEYKYDANGNLTQDFNKKIAKIQYNILNLPSALQFTEGHTSEYLYDAAGVKRKVKQVTTTENLLVPMGSMLPVPTDKVAITTQTDYCGNVIYENGTLSRILVDGGYITMSGTTPTYHYYIQDHQGNNRVVFNQNGTIEQANHYYSFGMTFGEGIDSSDNRYRYNNKELDRMHGLNLYDYGARMQDGMRFTTVDPLAEKYYSISPYAYCLNNPVKNIDPDGKDVVVLTAPAGAHGMGHMAILIQNKDHTWSLWSKNGTNESSGMSGPNDRKPDFGTGKFKSPEEFMKSTSNTVQEDGKREYTEGYKIETTSGQDEKAKGGATKELNKEYDVLGSNCAQTVQSALSAAGKADGSKVSLIDRIVNIITGGGTIGRTMQDKAPNAIYKRIKEQNEGTVIKTK